ncbi:hypothetical protein C9I50_23390 [Pseudomonas prosekii]|nr:hypothetical protein C9I50_23390 [Pseudomonas prosekii]
MIAPAKAGKFTLYRLARQGFAAERAIPPLFRASHQPCGEGACPRWAAKQPQNQYRGLVIKNAWFDSTTATQPNGGKPPRHKYCLPLFR